MEGGGGGRGCNLGVDINSSRALQLRPFPSIGNPQVYPSLTCDHRVTWVRISCFFGQTFILLRQTVFYSCSRFQLPARERSPVQVWLSHCCCCLKSRLKSSALGYQDGLHIYSSSRLTVNLSFESSSITSPFTWTVALSPRPKTSFFLVHFGHRT